MEQRLGYGLDELARRFDRGASWVSRVALVEWLPQAIQQQVREGKIAAQVAQLYPAWRQGTRVDRERILAEPELFLKTWRLRRYLGRADAEAAYSLGQVLLRRRARLSRVRS